MTTTRPPEPSAGRPLVTPFPLPGNKIQLLYAQLNTLEKGTPLQVNDILERHSRDLATIPRPWEPATITDPATRTQLWHWLDAVAAWINTEYAWDPKHLIPPCWPHHPHLVHDLAVLADHRHRAGREITSDHLEEWHRYTLPAFLDRMTARLKQHCATGHKPSPSHPRDTAYGAEEQVRARQTAYAADINAHQPAAPEDASQDRPGGRHLVLVDQDTGEVTDWHNERGDSGTDVPGRR